MQHIDESDFDESLGNFYKLALVRLGMMILVFACLFAVVVWACGCAKIHIVCPLGTVGVTQSGNNFGTGLIAMATSAAKIAGVAARGPTAPNSGAPAVLDPTLTTIDYSTFPIFGAEQEACLQPAPEATPAPVNVNVTAQLSLPPGTTVTAAPRVVGQSIEEREGK